MQAYLINTEYFCRICILILHFSEIGAIIYSCFEKTADGLDIKPNNVNAMMQNYSWRGDLLRCGSASFFSVSWDIVKPNGKRLQRKG